MKRCFIQFVACIIGIGLVFTSCSKKDSVQTDENGRVTIQFYTWVDAVHQPLVDAFNASQDEIFVESHILPSSDYETKMTALLSGRADVDCYMQKTQSHIHSHYANGYIEPLDAYFEKTGLSDKAVQNYKDQVTIDGHIYGIPWRGAAVFTYYNKKIFEKAGVPTPDYYVERGEWTWEKFEEVANKISSGDGKVLGSSIYFWGSCAFFRSAQNKQHIVTPDGKIQMDNSVLEYLQMRKRMEAAKSMWPLVDMKVTKTHYSKQFYDGNVGMLIIGEWFPGQMISGRNDNLLQNFTWNDYGITRMPCNHSEYITSGASTFSHVTSFSKKKEAAFKFIQWISDVEGSKVTASYGILPAIINDGVKQAVANSIPDQKSLDYYLEDRQCFAANLTKYGPRVETLVDSLTEEYLFNKINDEEFDAKFRMGCQEIIDTTD